MKEYLEFAKEIAYEAGKIMLKHFNAKDISSYKGDKTIVTLADKEINAYLIKEFKNNSQNQTIDNNILHIKEGSQNKYLNFETANKKLTFKDNCLAGDNISHNIDLMLKTDKAIDSDTYHGTIKLEIEQK